MTDDLARSPCLAAVLDELIPARDAELPGAGGLGVGTYVVERLGDATPVVAAALDDLDGRARERGASGFAQLPAADRPSLLETVNEEHPGFVAVLVFHTYGGYYQQPRVLAAIGIEPRPPAPEGYDLEQGDLGLLDAVRRRAKLYRDS